MSYGHTVRVYWEDTDAGGIVFYANYLKFFERARTEWLRSLGISQQKIKNELGEMFVVSETHMKYHAPAVLDDSLEIHTLILERGRSSLTLDQKAFLKPPQTSTRFIGNELTPGAFGSIENYNNDALKNSTKAPSFAGKELKLLCSGTIRIGWINVQSGRPTRIPSLILEKL
jgi:acyl-CoA thioester hydrolase